MTLLTISNNVADEMSITRPTTIIGNDGVDPRRMLRFITKACQFTLQRVDWQSLREEHTFTATAGEAQTGGIPADFDRFVPDTFWDRTNKNFISGPVLPVEWSNFKASSSTSDHPHKFLYRGSTIHIHPAPSGSEAMAYEYVRNTYIVQADSTEIAAFADDTDTIVWDEEMIILGAIWQFLKFEKDPSTGSALSEFLARIKQESRKDQRRSRVMSAGDIFGNRRRPTGHPSPSGSVIDVS